MNPFQYQGPVGPESLIGRSDELDGLQRAAADRVNVRLAAPRRFGKSSLLEAHLGAMRAAGHRAVRVDFYRVATITDVASRVVSAYSAALPIDSGRSMDRLLRDMGLTVGPGGISLQLRGRGTTEALGIEQARQVLLDVLDLPARLYADDGGLTVVAFDEFQDLLTADDRLDGLVRSVIQHHARAAAYVYAGSRPSLMRELFTDQERPFYGQSRPLALPALPAGETVRDIAATFAQRGHEPGRAIDDIVAVAGGHPQRTMLLAHHLLNAVEEDAGDDLAEVAVERAMLETADVHQAAWESLDRPERSVVVALADGAAPTGQRTAREHAISRGSLQRALERLVAEQRHVTEGPVLLDPLFAEWLRRR